MNPYLFTNKINLKTLTFGSNNREYYTIRTGAELNSNKIAMKDGICIGFSSAIPVWARNTFKSAMLAWCEKIDMNIQVDYINNSTANSAVLDGISVVSNENFTSGGGIAALTFCQANCIPIQTNSYIQICGSDKFVFKEIDIKISNQALNGSMQSLYNVLLHEIGHVLMLNHSKNRGFTLDEEARYVMYFDQTNLNFNGGTRLIKADDEQGAQKLFTNSQQAIQNCGFMPISHGNCSLPCGTSLVSNSKFIQNINIFPNPSDGNFNLKSEDLEILGSQLTIYSLEGKVLWKQTIHEEQVQIDRRIFSGKGMFIIEIQTEDGHYWANKIILE